MNKQLGIHFRGALSGSLLLLCGAATAAALPTLPAAGTTGQPGVTTPALGVSPAAMSALPALPAAAPADGSAAGIDALANRSRASLPGLGGNSIRPIRVPNIVPLPVGIPVAAKPQFAAAAKLPEPDAIRPIRLPGDLPPLDPTNPLGH